MSDAIRGPAPRKLTAEGLAQEADTNPGYVRRLVESGAIRPDADGLHDPGDVPRVRLAQALADGGVDVDGLTWAMRTGILPLDRISEMWTVPEPTGRTYTEFASALGDRGADLPAVYAAFGLAVPPPGTVMRQDEEEVLADFLDVWGMVDDRREAYLRAARIDRGRRASHRDGHARPLR